MFALPPPRTPQRRHSRTSHSCQSAHSQFTFSCVRISCTIRWPRRVPKSRPLKSNMSKINIWKRSCHFQTKSLLCVVISKTEIFKGSGQTSSFCKWSQVAWSRAYWVENRVYVNKFKTSWRFPSWKIISNGNLPKIAVKIKYIWNHLDSG